MHNFVTVVPETAPAGPLAAVPDLSVSLDVKIQSPEIRPEWLNRSPLLHRLSGTTARLILLSASAGSGKTVLVSQWRAAADGSRFAWTTLDHGDNDPSRLWWKVISAVRRACPEFDVDPPQVLAQRQGRVLLPALIARLSSLRAPVVLVLDDYHLVNNHRCHAQVESLLRDLPQPVQVVLITRAIRRWSWHACAPRARSPISGCPTCASAGHRPGRWCPRWRRSRSMTQT